MSLQVNTDVPTVQTEHRASTNEVLLLGSETLDSLHLASKPNPKANPEESSNLPFKHFLTMCMDCQDSSGNTPLHCAIKGQNASADIEFFLGFVPPECLATRNADNCTPLDLAFEKKLWEPARVLAEHQLKTGAANPPEFLQSYFFRAVKEQGGVDFLPHLLDLWKCYCPDLDLNFGVDTTGRTPWWYLVNSNDVSVMSRVLQALKKYSIDITSLLTHTETGKTLVEEAVEKNRGLFTMIRKVSGWHHSEADWDTADHDIASTLGSSRALSRVSSCSSLTDLSSFDQSENYAIQLEQDVSFNASVIESQTSHLSSTLTSDSSDEESHQCDLKARKVYHRLKRHRIKGKDSTSSTILQKTDATLSLSESKFV